MKYGKYYKLDKTCNKFITAFQLFKTLSSNIDKLIAPMLLTGELVSTQFYDKVEECRTLGCANKSYGQEENKETLNSSYTVFFDFETITSVENTCLT